MFVLWFWLGRSIFSAHNLPAFKSIPISGQAHKHVRNKRAWERERVWGRDREVNVQPTTPNRTPESTPQTTPRRQRCRCRVCLLYSRVRRAVCGVYVRWALVGNGPVYIWFWIEWTNAWDMDGCFGCVHTDMCLYINIDMYKHMRLVFAELICIWKSERFIDECLRWWCGQINPQHRYTTHNTHRTLCHMCYILYSRGVLRTCFNGTADVRIYAHTHLMSYRVLDCVRHSILHTFVVTLYVYSYRYGHRNAPMLAAALTRALNGRADKGETIWYWMKLLWKIDMEQYTILNIRISILYLDIPECASKNYKQLMIDQLDWRQFIIVRTSNTHNGISIIINVLAHRNELDVHT